MPAYITAGEVFTSVSPGKSVTATRLNNHVNGLTILPAFITSQTAETPSLSDFLVWADVASTKLRKVTLTNLFGTQVTDAAAGTASLRTLGNSGNKAAPGSTTPGLALSNVFTGDNKFCQIGGTNQGTLAIAAGAGLGTGGSPSATLDASANGLFGQIVLVTGSTGGTGTVATLTLDKTFANAPKVFIVAYNSAAIANQATTSRIQVTSVTTTTAVISNAVALPISSTIVYQYLILGL